MKASTSSICGLCGALGPLCESHLVPKFAFRRLKSESPTGKLRGGLRPLKRLQDGVKEPFLCAGCEGLFSVVEDHFARTVFHPILNGTFKDVVCDDHHIRFAASLAWRALAFVPTVRDIDAIEFRSLNSREMTAREVLRGYLVGDRVHPADVRHHFQVFGANEHKDPAVASLLFASASIDISRSSSGFCVSTFLPSGICLISVILDGALEWAQETRLAIGRPIRKNELLPPGWQDSFFVLAMELQQQWDETNVSERLDKRALEHMLRAVPPSRQVWVRSRLDSIARETDGRIEFCYTCLVTSVVPLASPQSDPANNKYYVCIDCVAICKAGDKQGFVDRALSASRPPFNNEKHSLQLEQLLKDRVEEVWARRAILN